MADLAVQHGAFSTHPIGELPAGGVSRVLKFAELSQQAAAAPERARQIGLVIEHILAKRMRKLGSYRRIDGDTYQVDFTELNDDDATIIARLLTEEVRQKLLLS